MLSISANMKKKQEKKKKEKKKKKKKHTCDCRTLSWWRVDLRSAWATAHCWVALRISNRPFWLSCFRPSTLCCSLTTSASAACMKRQKMNKQQKKQKQKKKKVKKKKEVKMKKKEVKVKKKKKVKKKVK